MTEYGAVVAGVLAFLITGMNGFWFIPYMRRIKAGQSIRDVGPTWHKSKQGTPIMGGIMFMTGILDAMFLSYLVFSVVLHFNVAMSSSQRTKLIFGLLMALIFGLIGFMDDYIKVIKKRNLGLTVRQKLVLQIVAGAIFLFAVYLSGDQGTTMTVPFLNLQWNLGVFYWPFALFIIVGTVNSVNLTDGVDGLCGSVTFVVAIAFMLCSRLLSMSGFTTLSAALAGGCLGFLAWNLHPAKVFMGDTGSLFLGGVVCALAFGIGQPLLLVPVGIIYMIETLSDIIQILSFKTTGKRVFKMSPIHHHFELSGWSENKIVAVFSMVTALCSVAAVIWMASYMGVWN